MDIASAQYTFNRFGRLDRISVVTDPDIMLNEVRQRLRAILPDGVTVQESSKHIVQLERLTRAFRMNLIVLSGVALMVGLFLIYNTVMFSVVQRRRDIGILRSLGMCQRRLMGLFIAEALCLGVLGGVLGTILGLMMAKSVLRAVSVAVSALYTPVDIGMLYIPPEVIPQGVGAAILVALTATIVPTRAAGQLNLVDALTPRAVDITSTHTSRWVSGFGGAFLLCVGWGVTFLDPLDGIPVFGYVAMSCLLLGFAAIIPLVLALVHWVARQSGRRCPSLIWGIIAAARLHQNAVQSTMTVSALIVGLAITVGVGVMIYNFRATVEQWMNQTMLADLIVVPTTWLIHGNQGYSGTRGTAGGAGGRMPDHLLDQAMGIDGIVAVDGYRETASAYRGHPIVVVSRDLVVHATRSRYLMLNQRSEDVLSEAVARGEILVSESFSRQFNVRRGDHVLLYTPTGQITLRVAGVFYDYAADGPRVVMDRKTYVRYWDDSLLNALVLYVDHDVDLHEVEERFMATLGHAHHLALLSNRDLKQKILHVFDKTFAVTYALELIAIIVALLGITNALFASIMERQRELAILRSIGGTPSHIRSIFLWESGILGFVGALFGCAAGLSLAFVLIRVVNIQSFGWSIQFGFPLVIIGGAMIVAFAASMAAGYVPSRFASRGAVARALQYE